MKIITKKELAKMAFSPRGFFTEVKEGDTIKVPEGVQLCEVTRTITRDGRDSEITYLALDKVDYNGQTKTEQSIKFLDRGDKAKQSKTFLKDLSKLETMDDMLEYVAGKTFVCVNVVDNNFGGKNATWDLGEVEED